VSSLAAQKTGSSKVRATKGGRVQQTAYLPPDLAKWVKIQAIEEDHEISEIVADAFRVVSAESLENPLSTCFLITRRTDLAWKKIS